MDSVNLYNQIFIFIATLIGFIASWITIYEWAKKNFTPEQEKALGDYLAGAEQKPQTPAPQQTTATENPIQRQTTKKQDHSDNWADYFIQIFDSFFRPNGQFLISPWRSMIATTIGLLLCAGLVTAVGGVEVWGNTIITKTKVWWAVALIVLTSNYAGDWISLAQTRWVIHLFSKRSDNFIYFLILVFLDYCLTIIIPLLVGISIMVPVISIMEGPTGIMNDLPSMLYSLIVAPFNIPIVCFLDAKPLFGEFGYKQPCSEILFIVPFMTTFITTFWFIMFATATWVARGPMKWLRGSQAQTIRNPFAVLVIIFSVMSFLLLSLIPLSLIAK